MDTFDHSGKPFNYIQNNSSLRDLCHILFRHNAKASLFFCVVLATVFLGTFFVSETYTSNAKLMVRLGKESVSLDPTATTGQLANVEPEFDSQINSEVSMLESRDLAGKLVDIFGPEIFLSGSPPAETDPALVKFRTSIANWVKRAFRGLSRLRGKEERQLLEAKRRDAAVMVLTKELRVERDKDNNIISVTFESDNPALARKVLTILIALYLDKHINAYRTKGSFAFFSKQHGLLEDTLAKTEEKLADFKKQLGVLPSRDTLLDQTATIESELEKTESDLAASNANIHTYKGKLSGIPETLVASESTGMPNSARDVLVQRLNDLKLKEHELLSTYLEESIPVCEIRKQIAEANSLLAQTHPSRQVTTAINHSHQQIEIALIQQEALYSALKAKEVILRLQLGDATAQLRRVIDTETQLAKMQRDLDIQDSAYRKYSRSMEQARIDEALQFDKISNISIIQPPSYELQPVRPRKVLNIALGMFVAIFGAIGLAYFAEFIEHTFNRPEDIESRLGVPAVATLPCLPGDDLKQDREKSKVRRPPTKDYSMKGGGEEREARTEFTSLHDMLPRLLKPSLDGRQERAAVIAVTSCHPGEGVSTVATYVASVLAEDRRNSRVLAVDANLGHSKEKVRPTASPAPAASETGTCAIRGGSTENVEVLALEKHVLDHARKGHLSAMLQLLPIMKREYSHIIFDLPPLWTDTAAIPIARAMDGVILVIEAGKTRWEVAKRAKDKLTEAGIPVMGAILNKRRYYIPQCVYRRL